MSFGVASRPLKPEDLLTPELTMPVQFQRVWHEAATTTPERSLAIRVLCQAAEGVGRFRYACKVRHQRLYVDASSWFASADRSWPYSFLNLCDALRRAELLETR